MTPPTTGPSDVLLLIGLFSLSLFFANSVLFFSLIFSYLITPLLFAVLVGLAQGGVHMLANDFDKRPLRRDKFDLLMQERNRRVNKPKEDE